MNSNEIEIIDGIVITQACDIANCKVNNIVLCAITSKKDFENNLKLSRKNDKEIHNRLESIIKGQQNAFYMMNNYISEDFTSDYYIVNFKDLFSIPIETVKSVAKSNGKRLRLCPPYREHLSQAFARYFMRVGLPINIKI